MGRRQNTLDKYKLYKISGFIVMILAMVFGCEKDEKGKAIVLKKLVQSSNSIRIPIDSLTDNRSMQLAYHQGSKGWFFNLNPKTNEIQMYDMENKTLHKRLRFSVEGNNSVGRIFSFYIHKLDSIFLFQQFSPNIYLTDTSGSVRKKITVQVPEMHTSPFVHLTYFSSPAVLVGEDVVVKTRPADVHNQITNDVLSKRHLTYSINLNNGETELLSHKFPNNYLVDGYRFFDFSFAKGLDKWVYSFHSDHDLYYSDARNTSLASVTAKSNYINGFRNFDLSGSREENYRYFASAPNYKSIFYDKFKNVYYRVCYPEIELTSEEEIMKYRFVPKMFSILILDSELNVIGETLFEKEKFLPDNLFITEAGVYLSKNHPDNPDLEEDYLSFALFELLDL